MHAWEKHGASVKAQSDWLESMTDEDEPLSKEAFDAENFMGTMAHLEQVFKDLLVWHSSTFRPNSLDCVDNMARQVLSGAYNHVTGNGKGKATADTSQERLNAVLTVAQLAKKLFPMDDDIHGMETTLRKKVSTQTEVAKVTSLKYAMKDTMERISCDWEVPAPIRSKLLESITGVGKVASNADAEAELNVVFWR
eukprot:9488576-Pyramimonas_sp.AAC.1